MKEQTQKYNPMYAEVVFAQINRIGEIAARKKKLGEFDDSGTESSQKLREMMFPIIDDQFKEDHANEGVVAASLALLKRIGILEPEINE